VSSKLLKDRIAFVTAAIGVVLMCFTILTHVNPVEGGVVRPRWLLSAWAAPLHLTLLVSSMPVMILSGHLQEALSHAQLSPTGRLDLVSVYGTMLILQGLLYFSIGKILSFSWRRWRCRRMAQRTGHSPVTRSALKHRQT
jgi:hypothetical protein